MSEPELISLLLAPAALLVTTVPSDRALTGWAPGGPGWIDLLGQMGKWKRERGDAS